MTAPPRPRPAAGRALARALPLALSLALGACALGGRESFTAADQAVATVPGFGAVRVWGDAPAERVARAVLPASGRAAGRDVNVLALSGGGAGGAFAAGLLDGWTRRGDRPAFDVVTGVSTGALIAPFAFLGPAYDGILAKLYTGDGAGGVAEPANIVAIATGDGAKYRPRRLVELGQARQRAATQHGRRVGEPGGLDHAGGGAFQILGAQEPGDARHPA